MNFINMLIGKYLLDTVIFLMSPKNLLLAISHWSLTEIESCALTNLTMTNNFGNIQLIKSLLIN